MLKVLIVEDETGIRTIIKKYLRKFDITCIEAENGKKGLEIFTQNKDGIDLILMDVCTAMGESGLAAAETIKRKYPHIKIIIVTSMPECSYMERAKAAGVESFWYKEISKEPILALMDRTVAGESVYPDKTPEVTLGNIGSYELSDRELEVLRELTSGDPDAVIAERLHMSVWTVRSHIRHMLEKTGFDSRTRLAVAARESGLVILGY